MGKIFVFNKLRWKPPIASTKLKAPELELNLSYEDDQIVPMPAKQRSTFDAKFKAEFDGKFDSMSKARIAKIQEAVAWTEGEMLKKSDKKQMEEVVETSNKLLKQAFETWQSEIAKLCEDCVTKAYEASVAVMKLKLVKAKIKAACKIVVIAGLVLLTAALVIAASVTSGGALAPLIVGAIGTGASALYKAYTIFDSKWATSANKIKEIEADIKALKEAIETYKKTETSYAGVADKAKALKVMLMAPVTEIDKHVGQLDKFVFEMQETIKAQKAKLLELADKASDANSVEVGSAVKACIGKIDQAMDRMKAVESCKSAVAEIKAAYAAQKIPDYGKLGSFVAKVSSASTTITEIGTALKSCFEAFKKLGVAVPI